MIHTPQVKSMKLSRHVSHNSQGRPVNVKHGARCVVGKVGKERNPKRWNFIVLI